MIEAVADRLEKAPRQLRRRWSDVGPQVATEALELRASVSAIARRIGIHPALLFAWRCNAWASSIVAPGTRVARVWWHLCQAR
ncbi:MULTISPECIES: transposase [Bradyrhizobium]|uniref:transposase n=1 Tax=Bradyrhizobium TaxID=374 RepID=UPI0009BEC818